MALTKPLVVKTPKSLIVEGITNAQFGTLHGVSVGVAGGPRDWVVDQITIASEHNPGGGGWQIAFFDGPNGLNADLDVDEVNIVTTLTNTSTVDQSTLQYHYSNDLNIHVRLAVDNTDLTVPEYQRKDLKIWFKISPVTTTKPAGGTADTTVRFVLLPSGF